MSLAGLLRNVAGDMATWMRDRERADSRPDPSDDDDPAPEADWMVHALRDVARLCDEVKAGTVTPAEFAELMSMSNERAQP